MKRTDTPRPLPPFTPPERVLPIFVCFRFPNGTSYAGSIDTLMRFRPEVLLAADVSFRPQREALRWAVNA